MTRDLIEAAESFSDIHVLCIGDPMLDEFIYGHTSRISPEAPIPVLKFGNMISMLGGAANAARNACSLGARVTLLAPIGADQAGEALKALQSAESSLEARFVTDPRGTIVKSRYVSAGQQLLRVDREHDAPLSSATLEELLTIIPEAVKSADILVMSDYGKGAISSSVCRAAIGAAKTAGISVIVDPRGNDFSKYAGSLAVTPNLAELQIAIGSKVLSSEDVVAAARSLAASCDIKYVVVTRGGDGVSVVDRDGLLAHIPAHKVSVFDVSGAGDTFVGAFACALASQFSVLEAATYANAASSVSVAKLGTATVSRAEVAEKLRVPAHIAVAKIASSQEEALGLVSAWRSKGRRIGFTNGCFDLLHSGHLHVLREAAKLCDRLIVGVNDDDSIRRLKGMTRPVLDQATRVDVVSSLAFVDLVVLFSEDTPANLIESLRPDILVKGGDYAASGVAGADTVRRGGGEVRIIPTLEGHSTTATVQKVLRAHQKQLD